MGLFRIMHFETWARSRPDTMKIQAVGGKISSTQIRTFTAAC
jgi:hypothetical protein